MYLRTTYSIYIDKVGECNDDVWKWSKRRATSILILSTMARELLSQAASTVPSEATFGISQGSPKTILAKNKSLRRYQICYCSAWFVFIIDSKQTCPIGWRAKRQHCIFRITVTEDTKFVTQFLWCNFYWIIICKFSFQIILPCTCVNFL